MNKFQTTFALRDKDDMLLFYKRVEFWGAALAAVFIILSVVLPRYSSGTMFDDIWRMTNGSWSLALCIIACPILVLYELIANFLFKTTGPLCAIDMVVGLLIAGLHALEYVMLTQVGAYTDADGVAFVVTNSAGIGFYLGVLAGVIIAGMSFYKMNAGYYTKEEIIQARRESGVKVVDGVVVIDGEKVEVNETNDESVNETRIRVLTDSDNNISNDVDNNDNNDNINDNLSNADASPNDNSMVDNGSAANAQVDVDAAQAEVDSTDDDRQN